MRIGRAVVAGSVRTVAHVERRWCDVTDAMAALSPPAHAVSNLIDSNRMSGETLRALAAQSPNIAEPVQFELPLVPSKVVCLGRNYAEHARELGNAVPDEPVLFNKTPNTYLADGGSVVFDPSVGRVDHEGEIALVMGPNGAIAGLTLLNDVTARDLQAMDKAKGLPWFRSKNLDTFCPVGPVIRLADSLPNPFELDLEVRVNGDVRQRGNTRQFIFSVRHMLDYISKYVRLMPGDLVATGTPPGVGPLHDGDRVEVRCPEIGTLYSTVRAKGRPNETSQNKSC